jgi:hypothetical protein
MKTLQTLIDEVPNWQQLTPEQLLTKLEEKTIHYVDPKPYRLDDIAKLIGDVNMNTFLDVVRAAGYDWMITQAASGFYPYEDPINSRLRLLNHPLSLQIANHTNRMISLLEQNNLVTTPEEVAQVQASMKLALYVEAEIDKKQDQLNTYKEAMNLWDGTPETEPEF